MPADKTIDTVLMIIAGGLLTLGLLSVFIGWVVRTWDRIVNRSQIVTSSAPAQTNRQTQTDGQTDEASVGDRWIKKLEVDRTRTAVIEELVYIGWGVSEIRNVIKGDSGAIGQEVEAARKRLGMAPSQPYVTPIARRPTQPDYYADDPKLAYQPPD